MNRFQTAVEIRVVSDLEHRMNGMGRSLDRFSRNGKQALNGLRASAMGLSNGLDLLGNRWTALGSVISIGGTARYLMTLETQLKRIKVQAGLSSVGISRFKDELFQVANLRDVAKSPEELLAAVDTIISKTGDIDLARRNLRNIGLAMSASGSNGEDIGAMVAEMSQKLNVSDPKDIQTMLDLLAAQGKQGTFELRDMATQGPRVFTAMNRTGRQGVDAVREMGAVLQIVRRGTSSAEQASTAYERMIGGLIEKQKQLKKLGVSIWDPNALKQGRQQMRSTITIFEELIRKTKGDQATLSKLFGEEAIRGVSSMATEWQKTKRFDSLEHFYKIHADGKQILKDAAEMADTTSSSIERVNTSAKHYAESRFAKPLKQGGNLLSNFLDQPGASDMVMNGLLGIGGLVLANKAIRGVGGLLGKGKAGNVIGGALGMAGGAMPVYVVNFPGQGTSMPLGEFWSGAAGEAVGQGVRGASRWGTLAKIGKQIPGMGRLLPAVEAAAENPAVAKSLGVFAGAARSPLGKLAGAGVKRLGVPLALLFGGLEIGNAAMHGDRHGAVVATGGLGGGLAGMGVGAAAGAAIGSVVPVVGTAAGGIVGAILGGLGGDVVGRALAGAIDSTITQKAEPLTKPKKDELSLKIQVNGPATVTGVSHKGDSVLKTGVMTSGQ